MTDQSTTELLAARGYTHTPCVKRNGRRCIIRDGRIVAVRDCFGANDWVRRLDRKLASLRSR